jgi:hypothetical protein
MPASPPGTAIRAYNIVVLWLDFARIQCGAVDLTIAKIPPNTALADLLLSCEQQ